MSMPVEVLERTLNRKISLQLKDGRVLTGKLKGYDEYMNLVLEETEERTEDVRRRLGLVVLRGNNVITMTPVE
ncbi:MAG: LSM domain-containing protein [Thermoplasmata archaeon]|nr:LSM domain-containing protein [Thermoplasmata archaeon]